MQVERWPSGAPGRSRSVAYGGLVWTVANAKSSGAAFQLQVEETLAMLDAHLIEAGSSREQLLSLQVILAKVTDRPAFDRLWQAWIGTDLRCWPQRACYQAALAPGLSIEVIAIAANGAARNASHA